MSSDTSSGLAYAGGDRSAGPGTRSGGLHRSIAVDPPREPLVGPEAAYRAELTMREVKLAALERELTRRDRRHAQVVERYERLLEQRNLADSEAAYQESDRGLITAVRDRLPW